MFLLQSPTVPVMRGTGDPQTLPRGEEFALRSCVIVVLVVVYNWYYKYNHVTLARETASGSRGAAEEVHVLAGARAREEVCP